MAILEADVFRPTERYLKDLSYLRHEAAPSFRYASARKMIEHARRAAGQPAKRFRVIKDVAFLLHSPEGSPEQLLLEPIAQPPSQQEAQALGVLLSDLIKKHRLEAPDDLLDELNAVLEETQRTTWSSFEEFVQSDQGSRKFRLTQCLDDLADFDEWFAQALPVLGLRLPEGMEQAQAGLSGRIEFLLSKIASSERADVFGLRERYAFEAWAYVRRLMQKSSEPDDEVSAMGSLADMDKVALA